MSKIFFFFFLLFLFSICSCNKGVILDSDDKIIDFFRKGEKAYKDAQLSKSFEYFDSLLFLVESNNVSKEIEKKHIISLCYMGEIYKKLGDDNSAFRKFLECSSVSKKYNNKQYEIISIINIAYLENNSKDSKEVLEKAIINYALNNEDAVEIKFLKYKLALINVDLGHLDIAEKEINHLQTESVSLSDKNDLDLYNSNLFKALGKIYLKRGEYDKAIVYYHNSLNLIQNSNTSKAELHLLISKTYFEQKKYSIVDSSLNVAKALINDDLIQKKQLNELYLKLYEATNNTEKGFSTLTTLREIDNYLKDEKNSIHGYISSKLEYENQKAETYLHKARVKYISGIAILLLMLSSLYYLYKQARNKKNLLELEVSKNKIEFENKQLEVENKQLEVENQTLEVKNTELELAAVNKVIDAQEEKEKEFAEILHDNVGANLSALNMFLSTLKKDVPQNKYDHLSKVLSQTIKNSRHLAHLLVPPALKGGGLVSAIIEKAEEFTCERLVIEVVSTQEFIVLEDNVARALYNSILEFMNNTIRHSGATNMQIDFILHNNQTLAVKITDNGKGFDTTNIPQSKGLGLNSIKSRIKYFGGSFDIQSSSNGTTIKLTVPVREALKQSA